MSRNIEIARTIRSGIESARTKSSGPSPWVKDHFLAVASLMRVWHGLTAEEAQEGLRQAEKILSKLPSDVSENDGNTSKAA